METFFILLFYLNTSRIKYLDILNMCNLVIFGASGDISRKKIFPGLYEWYLEENKCLNKIIGYGRSKFNKNEFDEKIGIYDNEFLNHFDYQIGEYDKYDDFINLKDKIEGCIEPGSILLFYFGVPSELAPKIIKNIVLTHLNNKYDCRYLIEKPIGKDLVSCEKIFDLIRFLIEIDRVYIIDHYLGKKNLITLMNTEKKKVEKIIMYLNEVENVDHRLEYFDQVGLFKDMVQSHVLTILIYCFND